MGFVALHEHFDDACGATEIAVDLKGWVGTVAVKKTSPERHFPGQRPPGALVTALLQGCPGGIEPIRFRGGDLVGGIEPVQMRAVAVSGFGLVIILEPLLELTALANLERSEAVAFFLKLLAERVIDVEDRSGPVELPPRWWTRS